jgi:nucleoside-triphosphatase THEP1
LSVAGVIAESADAEGVCSAGFLRDLASGERFSIQLEKAPAHTSCHLDGSGVNKASAKLIPQIAAADIVILSKFGKLEAEGRGLWSAFEAAIKQGKLVLTTISAKHQEAWDALVPATDWLEGDLAEIRDWHRRWTEPAITLIARTSSI